MIFITTPTINNIMISLYNGLLFKYPFDSNAVYDSDGERYLTMGRINLEKSIILKILIDRRMKNK